MSVNTRTEAELARVLTNPDLAKDLVTNINSGVGASGRVSTYVAALSATTNITAVPGSFADAAAVQSYLAGANVVPNIEARLDNLESKVNALLAALVAAGLMASS